MTKKLAATVLLATFLTCNFGYAAVNQVQIQPEKLTKTEHLIVPKAVSKKSPTDLVVTSNTLATVIEHNVMEITFAENFSTKTAKVGDNVYFMLNSGLITKEGTEILPKGSQVVAEVVEMNKPKSFNRSGKVLLAFKSIITPDGKIYPLQAKVFAKKEQLSRSKLSIFGKGAGTTLGFMGAGIGAGCGIGVAAGAVIIGGFAIGLPVGVAVGALLGFATPGLHYKAKAGDKLLIQLTNDLDVYKQSMQAQN